MSIENPDTSNRQGGGGAKGQRGQAPHLLHLLRERHYLDVAVAVAVHEVGGMGDAGSNLNFFRNAHGGMRQGGGVPTV